jgi:hypothetical protein
MQMKLFITAIMCFFSLAIFSQDRKLIKGKVFVNEPDELLSNIYVTNKTAKYTTVTDIIGNYALEAKKGDTLVFQGFNVQNRTLLVTRTMENYGFMTVHLDIKERMIAGVNVFPKITGNLELDVKRLPDMNLQNKLMAKLGDLMPTQKLDGSTDVNTEAQKAAAIKIGIDGILDVLSGNAKRKERLLAYENQLNAVKIIRGYFGDEYFVGIGLDKSEIDDFILYTYLNQEVDYLYRIQNYFQILRVFDKTVIAFKARKSQNKITPKIGGQYFSEEK